MITVANSAEFTRLIETMSRDIVDAHIHYNLFRDLHAALKNRPIAEAQSRTFWSLTLGTHLDKTVQLLSRIYDQNSKALHLRSWLITIKDNIELFDEINFRERLKDNAYVESLATHPRKPEPVVLDQDIDLCSTKEQLVKTLQIHRGNRIAHRNARDVIDNRNIGDAYPLTYGDVEVLLERAVTILNRYSNLFAANTYSTQIIGDDDFNFILQCVEERVQTNRDARKQRRTET